MWFGYLLLLVGKELNLVWTMWIERLDNLTYYYWLLVGWHYLDIVAGIVVDVRIGKCYVHIVDVVVHIEDDDHVLKREPRSDIVKWQYYNHRNLVDMS